MAASCYQSSPPKLTERGFDLYNSNALLLANKRKDQLRRNMARCYLGPMDPSKFMTSFMPINSRRFGNPPRGIHLNEVYQQPNERSMYEPLVNSSLVLFINDLLTLAQLHSWQS